jgi:hypothetical protein
MICQMPNAKCQMPNAKCQMPNAKCQMYLIKPFQLAQLGYQVVNHIDDQ